MDLSAITPNSARPVAVAPEDRGLPQASGTAPAAEPQTQTAVRQSVETQELGDRPEQRAPGELTEEERAVVQKLKARDREVRAHEQAHKLVGGPYAGAISYDFQRGPDGQNYAVGGSVPIDVSPEAEPEDTAAKMRVVIKAALAPAEPSSADRAVAAAAQAQLRDAEVQMAAERAAERRGEDPEASQGGLLSLYATTDEEPQEPQIALTV
ncbi:MAG: putative metalloprotease CJM1_0395 family protein [Pseudomonadota bacterium]